MAKDEIEKQKSLALAELVWWNHSSSSDGRYISCMPPWSGEETLCPYVKSQQGYAQFAAILLKFPEVITMFVQVEGCGHEQCCGDVGLYTRPTQTNLLNAILHMKGKWQEEWSD